MLYYFSAMKVKCFQDIFILTLHICYMARQADVVILGGHQSYE